MEFLQVAHFFYKFRHFKMRNRELCCDQVQNDVNGGRDSIAAAAETDVFSYL